MARELGPAAAMDCEEQLELLIAELRSKATELFLREQWEQSFQVYSQLISLCQDGIQSACPERLSKLQRTLCISLSNRAEARQRMRDLDEALQDCDDALGIEKAHFKTLLCKGRILLEMNRYAPALECFRLASLDPQASTGQDALSRLLERCRKLEVQSRTGNFDLSDWVLGRFSGELPELAEYVGAVEIRKSDLGGRGLYATKNIDAGTPLLVTKAMAIERGILLGEELNENKQLVMWKNFVSRVADSASKCKRMSRLIGMLSSGEEAEGELEVPDIAMFRPEGEVTCSYRHETVEMGRILSILDLNSLVEDAISAKVLGRNQKCYGIGIWILSSLINHSCCPNARRLHVGDYLIAHASRDIKAGEEITFPYFDVLMPLETRRKMSGSWGFQCCCKRCEFEAGMSFKQETKDVEIGLDVGMDPGSLVYRLEEGMRRLGVRGKEKGYLRASLWGAYSGTYGSEKVMRRWGRRVPPLDTVVDSIVETVGGDERVVKTGLERVKRSGGGVVEMERAFKLGRGLYGKVMRKQALKALMDL